jgi:hypothetical protein
VSNLKPLVGLQGEHGQHFWGQSLVHVRFRHAVSQLVMRSAVCTQFEPGHVMFVEVRSRCSDEAAWLHCIARECGYGYMSETWCPRLTAVDSNNMSHRKLPLVMHPQKRSLLQRWIPAAKRAASITTTRV